MYVCTSTAGFRYRLAQNKSDMPKKVKKIEGTLDYILNTVPGTPELHVVSHTFQKNKITSSLLK